MKKKWVFALLGICLAAAVLLLLLPREGALAELNQNSRLPVPLCTPEDQALEQLTESLTYVPGFGIYALDNDDICVHFSGWPDLSDSYHAVGIDLFSPGYHILGLQVGDSLENARDILSQYGYKSDEQGLRYKKQDLSVTLYAENGLLTRIDLRAQSTNKHKLVF